MEGAGQLATAVSLARLNDAFQRERAALIWRLEGHGITVYTNPEAYVRAIEVFERCRIEAYSAALSPKSQTP